MTTRDRLRDILREYRKHRHVTSFADGVITHEQAALDAIVALFAEGERDRDDLIVDLFAQGAWGSGDAEYPMDDSCLSTYEDAARHLMAIGRLERHPTKRRYRWTNAAKEE